MEKLGNKPHVPAALDDLSGEISGLVGVCEEFEKRLGSVLAAVPPDVKGDPVPEAPLCGLAEQIRAEYVRLQRARRGLQRLLDRVQL